MNYPEFVKSLAKPFPDKQDRINHALVGMLGEVGELIDVHKREWIYEQPFDLLNIIEELGDFYFYFTMLKNEFRAPERNYYPIRKVHFEMLVFKIAGDLSFMYEIDDPETMEFYIDEVEGIYLNILAELRISQYDILTHNISKLQKRYPNASYSNEDAIARADKKD